jgi:hypothetical protein
LRSRWEYFIDWHSKFSGDLGLDRIIGAPLASLFGPDDLGHPPHAIPGLAGETLHRTVAE